MTTTTRTTGLPLWVLEFGSGYEVPAEVAGALEDVSWHNDACPSFVLEADLDEPPRLWVEHPDRGMRESEAVERFTVTDGEAFLYAGGDPRAALAALEAAKARRNADTGEGE